MTLANRITVLRILMIPLFVLVTLDYVKDFQKGEAKDWQYCLAFAIFAMAAVSDALDGYIARRYHQKTELGTLLDPIADKALLLSGLVVLSRNHGGAFDQLPIWFATLVISREVILVCGSVLIHMLVGKVSARPRLMGKCATFFQMVTLAWVLLKIDSPSFIWPMIVAGVFTFISGLWYIFDGVKQLNVHEAKKA
ncbi:MAG TPA: CDP-diacylglycerol--glycerol-3-phosphate 3-phosphatidyltransferase [Verrucomicrobiae bacterium]|nr:CDP-diacylglycerol--glycerol-3-phosphate 3-phosphatidyltransferase [Verrucomicrobiae bacterium]